MVCRCDASVYRECSKFRRGSVLPLHIMYWKIVQNILKKTLVNLQQRIKHAIIRCCT